MSFLKLDISQTKQFYNQEEFSGVLKEVVEAHKLLRSKSGPGNDFLGWLDLPFNYDKDEFARIKKAALTIRKKADVLVVIGIGGSYLGAKSALEMLSSYFGNDELEVIFVGHQLSGTYIAELIEYLENKEFAINVISKSGTTTESAIAFRVFKNLIEKRYGKEEARSRIFATTDKSRGVLKTLAVKEGYESFIVPDDVGGRFSVLTAVGLLPIAAKGINIDEMMRGAYDSYLAYQEEEPLKNDAILYATVRNVLYRGGKKIEMLINYEPRLTFLAEWWKQLYGESEGKDGKGLFVASASFSTDLHSLGQMIQAGERTIFETIINVVKNDKDLVIEKQENDLDGLNFLSGMTFELVNKKAMQGTLLAHVDGGVPNIVLNIPNISAYTYGYLVYFFEIACAISGYTLGVNPFDQPGVEAYKKNMFALLGKPGYEELRYSLEGKLNHKI